MKVGIIGGGACGLMLGYLLKKNNIEYTIFEKSICGRKILASGNGKANIANINLSPKDYNNELGFRVVSEYKTKFFEILKELNIYTKVDSEGRMYPYSESSQTILDAFLNKTLKVNENITIDNISRINNKFYLNNVYGPYDYLVLCSGSIAAYTLKKQQNFNKYLDFLNLKIIDYKPSLVGFKLDYNFKTITGVRVKCEAKLIKNDTIIYAEKGEVIFKNDGISGICILNLSCMYNRLKDKADCYISLDLIPDLKIKIDTLEQLDGLFNPKLAKELKHYSLDKINDIVHDYRFKIIGVYDYEFCQVVSGGIDVKEIDWQDLSLNINHNIFAGGEILDVDGVCGGYNLMFAFCCALKIGEKLCNIK